MVARRRVLIAGLGLLASPALAQATRVWHIGLLMPRSRPASMETDYYGAFPRAMRVLGYVEGKNVRYEWRFADGKMEALPGFARELVQLEVDVIVTAGAAPARAAQRATRTIPIVMASVGDPFAVESVASLARPGSNVTGLTTLAADIGPKMLELLTKTVPKVSKVAALLNPASPMIQTASESLREAAQKSGVEVTLVNARTSEDIQRAFSMIGREGAKGLIVLADPYLIQQRRQIAELAAKNRLPAIYGLREHAEAGGLMSYGPNRAELYGRAATYVDRILKGSKPGELPIEQPTKFDFVINLKAAKALGLKFPREVTTLADEVIR